MKTSISISVVKSLLPAIVAVVFVGLGCDNKNLPPGEGGGGAGGKAVIGAGGAGTGAGVPGTCEGENPKALPGICGEVLLALCTTCALPEGEPWTETYRKEIDDIAKKADPTVADYRALAKAAFDEWAIKQDYMKDFAEKNNTKPGEAAFDTEFKKVFMEKWFDSARKALIAGIKAGKPGALDAVRLTLDHPEEPADHPRRQAYNTMRNELRKQSAALVLAAAPEKIGVPEIAALSRVMEESPRVVQPDTGEAVTSPAVSAARKALLAAVPLDGKGRPQKITYADGSSLEFTYDEAAPQFDVGSVKGYVVKEIKQVTPPIAGKPGPTYTWKYIDTFTWEIDNGAPADVPRPRWFGQVFVSGIKLDDVRTNHGAVVWNGPMGYSERQISNAERAIDPGKLERYTSRRGLVMYIGKRGDQAKDDRYFLFRYDHEQKLNLLKDPFANDCKGEVWERKGRRWTSTSKATFDGEILVTPKGLVWIAEPKDGKRDVIVQTYADGKKTTKTFNEKDYQVLEEMRRRLLALGLTRAADLSPLDLEQAYTDGVRFRYNMMFVELAGAENDAPRMRAKHRSDPNFILDNLLDLQRSRPEKEKRYNKILIHIKLYRVEINKRLQLLNEGKYAELEKLEQEAEIDFEPLIDNMRTYLKGELPLGLPDDVKGHLGRGVLKPFNGMILMANDEPVIFGSMVLLAIAFPQAAEVMLWMQLPAQQRAMKEGLSLISAGNKLIAQGKAAEGRAKINQGAERLAEGMTNTALIAGPSLLLRAKAAKPKVGAKEGLGEGWEFLEIQERLIKDISPELKATSSLADMEAALLKLEKQIPPPPPGGKPVLPEWYVRARVSFEQIGRMRGGNYLESPFMPGEGAPFGGPTTPVDALPKPGNWQRYLINRTGYSYSALYGELAEASVQSALARVKSGQIKNVEELLTFLAQERQRIAEVMQDPAAYQFGSLRPNGETLTTPIGPKAERYHYAWLERLKQLSAEANKPYGKEYTGQIKGKIGDKEVPLTKWTYVEETGAALPDHFTKFWSHTESARWPEILRHCEELFARAMDPKLPVKQTVETVAELHWWLAQGTPYRRGSAAIADMVTKAIFDHRCIQVGPWKKNIVGDIEALVQPDVAKFKADYPSFFETPPALKK